MDSVKAVLLVCFFFSCMLMICHSIFTYLLFSDDISLIVVEPDVSHVLELSNHLFVIMNK